LPSGACRRDCEKGRQALTSHGKAASKGWVRKGWRDVENKKSSFTLLDPEKRVPRRGKEGVKSVVRRKEKSRKKEVRHTQSGFSIFNISTRAFFIVITRLERGRGYVGKTIS